MFSSIDSNLARYLIIGIVISALVFGFLYYLLQRLGKSPKNILPVNIAARIRIPMALLILSLFLRIGRVVNGISRFINRDVLGHIATILLIISITWLCIIALSIFKSRVLQSYDMKSADNMSARKVYTQFTILERVIVFLLVLFAVGIALMSFPSIRSIGATMLGSAGIAGIIIGFAAQKALGTLLAGIQIAITQPIRIDDVVIVENEWGWIEEIFLTYVVVKIWDKRRLVLPTTYFIDKPFQNWTRNSSDILGTVFIHTDYNVPFDALRKELTRLLESTPLWDGLVNVLQVTDAQATTVESRALMSAKDSPTAWDLRVFIREKMIDFIRENYPESLPRTRVEMLDHTNKQGKTDRSHPAEAKLMKDNKNNQ
ncbi:mechanosensitive ion channel family protein [Leeuwenhoekiella sp. A16]|uniref:mechanosensitive ion channel family protein n=1 Tax=unclassified Leeuwenhoekiella TaxID=2615029 RepID=UPI003A805B9E|tara:strand:- start:145209 stop:146324 length:1116 start_codon:yes stop_codon:yes gene_type:complete